MRTDDGVVLRGLVAAAALPGPLAPGARPLTSWLQHGFTDTVAVGRHRPDAVVSVSAASRWYMRETRPTRRMHWLTPRPSPLQLVDLIAPTPQLLVVPGSGHAESGATAPLVEGIGRWVSATINP